MAGTKRERVPDYPEMVKHLTDRFPEVDGKEFYKDIFPDNENAGEHKKNKEFQKPNAVYLYSTADGKMHRRIMLKDTWSQDYDTFVKQNTMTLCSGLTFSGRTNQMQHAQRMHALIIDLDRVGLFEIQAFFKRTEIEPGEYGSIPKPTYIVASGGGVHVYYVFEVPIDLYPNIKLQCKQLKYDLIHRVWDYKSTSQDKNIQYQGIAQGYRMPGSINAKYGTVIRAFRTGNRVTIDYLNKYAIDKDHQVNLLKPFRPTKMSLEKAKETYPEWYQRRIVERQKPNHWHIKKDLYDWWIRQVDRIEGGHRYFFVMVLAIYASKCDVPYETLKKDATALIPRLKSIPNHGDDFTEADVKSALEAYDKGYTGFTIDDIEHITAIRIERNRRNGRPQNIHLMGARALQDIKHKVEGTNWRQGNGRKRKCEVVYTYRREHPEAKKVDCIRDLKLSKPTVYRWWNYVPEPKPGQE